MGRDRIRSAFGLHTTPPLGVPPSNGERWHGPNLHGVVEMEGLLRHTDTHAQITARVTAALPREGLAGLFGRMGGCYLCR